MKKPDKTKTTDESPDEMRLRYECEQALLRGRFESPSVEDAWQKFCDRVGERAAEKPLKKHRRTSLLRMIGSAAAVAAIVLGIVWLLAGNKPVAEESEVVTLFAATGHPGRVTVAEAGKEAAPENCTDNGAVYSETEADYTRTSAADSATHILSIPCGQVYKITLADGTKVWLNADSRLTFPTRFAGPKRTVRLEGEAYFDVAHDERRPFVIVTEHLTTQVLGTEFNMKAYKGSETHVTLVEGSVKLHLSAQNRELLLAPGEDAVCTAGDVRVRKVDTSYYTQWREGYFYFDDASLADILSDLGRWYNLTIEMEKDSLLLNQRLHFVADRSEDVARVMENLQAFDYLSVTKNENKLTVKRKK